ncbi:MAG: SsrA-binding protein SmpB [bacterium]
MPVLALNKQARHSYEILETLEVGLVLLGHEVKAIKAGQINLRGSYISLRLSARKTWQAYLISATVAPYKYAGPLPNYQSTRDRQLLLNKKEIIRLGGKQQEQGLTLLPLKIYTKNGLIKLEIALAKGKKLHDKREALKRKDIEREVQRSLKYR